MTTRTFASVYALDVNNPERTYPLSSATDRVRAAVDELRRLGYLADWDIVDDEGESVELEAIDWTGW